MSEQTFGQNHSNEHRQNLRTQLENIVRQKDSIKEQLRRSENEDTLMRKIAHWENTTIAKVRQAADAARAELGNIIRKSNEQISSKFNDLSVNLQSAHDTNSFSEINIRQLNQKLQELQLEVESLSRIRITENDRSVIRLIQIHENTQPNHLLLENFPSPSFPERFSKVIETAANISEDGLLVSCTETSLNYTHVLCQNYYSQGRETIKFKIERRFNPTGIFMGCISFSATENDLKCLSSFAAGWFGLKEGNQNGLKIDVFETENTQKHEVSTKDILSLTLDCKQKQIELFHERTKQLLTLPIDIKKAPLPWRILLGLTFKGDSLRILP